MGGRYKRDWRWLYSIAPKSVWKWMKVYLPPATEKAEDEWGYSENSSCQKNPGRQIMPLKIFKKNLNYFTDIR